MSKFGSKEEILSAIQLLFENIQSGSLTADEMESLVELTRELHERALILRYKSYEEKIFGVVADHADEETFSAQESTQAEEVIAEVPHVLSFEEVEQQILENEPQIVVDDAPVFDFDMFEKAENDIFTPAIEDTPTPEIVAPVVEEFTQKEAPLFAQTSEEKMDATLASEEVAEPFVDQAAPAFAVDDINEAPFTATTESIGDQTEINISASEPELVVNSTPEIDTSIFSKYSNTDDSLSARLMSSKLQTLVGSFGLNEKLQCIRELFQGSSEAFNQGIAQLDNQIDFAAAKRVLAMLAQQYSWDLESNLTAEFIQKVERRYL